MEGYYSFKKLSSPHHSNGVRLIGDKARNDINQIINFFNFHNNTKYNLDDVLSYNKERPLPDLRFILYRHHYDKGLMLTEVKKKMNRKQHASIIYGIRQTYYVKEVREMYNRIKKMLEWKKNL